MSPGVQTLYVIATIFLCGGSLNLDPIRSRVVSRSHVEVERAAVAPQLGYDETEEKSNVLKTGLRRLTELFRGEAAHEGGDVGIWI